MKKLLLLLSIIFINIGIKAQMPGSNDPSFNPVDSGFGNAANAVIYSSAIQADGKIIIGGNFTEYNTVTTNRITRLKADGKLDATFNIGTGANGTVNSIALQTDGKIIIGGNFTDYNGTAVNRIARLNTDGSIDAAFNIGTGANGTVNAIAVQVDGKIVVGGNFTVYNGVANNYVVRLNTDGTLDVTFTIGTGADNFIKSIAIQSDSKIIVGGAFTNYNGVSQNRIARLNTNGTLDASLSIGTGANGNVNTISIQLDGKLIIGGQFTTYNGVGKNYLARIDAGGVIDATFNIGTGTNSYVHSTAIQTDGKIIVVGDFTSYNGTTQKMIVRLNTNATIDATFNIGTGTNNIVYTTAIQTDGKVIIGGTMFSYNGITTNYIARINTNGALDVSFNEVSGVNNQVNASAVQTDGRIIVGGAFTSYNGITKYNIVRLNTDGTLDNTFLASGIGWVYSLAIQPDGKIIVGGYYTIKRLNTDGTLDATFNVGSGVNSYVNAIAIQSDGKIIIGGTFTTYNGVARNRIARLNTDGSLDATFNIGTGVNNDVWAISLQTDSKVIVGGNFTSYNGTFKNRILRLDANGTLDATFNIGTGANSQVYATAIQVDGKIIIGGIFSTYNGTAKQGIARLNTNGALDVTFAGCNCGFRTIMIQSDGKIIAGGITRFNTNGTIDTSFNPGNINNEVYTSALQPDGKIIIGGSFTSYSGVGRNRIARLFGGSCITPSVNFSTVNPNCFGSSTGSINTSVSGGTAPYTYSWSPNGEVTQNITNKPAGSYTLLVTDNLGCSTTTSTVLSSPAALISSATANQTICSGSNVTLTITPTSTLTALTYTWMSSGNSLNNTNSAIVIATPSVTEIYTVSVTDGTCIETKTISITVNAQPTFTLSALSGTATCTSLGAGFSVNTPYGVVWSGPGVINPSTTVATVTITGSGIYTVTVVNGSCTNTGTVSVVTNTVAPIVNITATPVSFCAGGTATLTANSTPTNTVSYLWNNSVTTQSISVSPTVTTVYTATVTDNTSGCYASNSTTITVYPLPTLTVTGTNSVCLGSSAGFIGAGATTYTWNTGQTTSSISVNPTSTTIYSVTGTDMNGCINSETISVTVDNTCADVWPGDANSDGTADNLDVLELGLHYTQTGAPRANVSNSWQSYFANNWGGTITNGKNMNHSDCNGDGIINDNDTLSIYNNYNLTHTFKPVQTNTLNPQLSIVPDQPMVVKGMWGTASIYLGDATSPINNINGIAYTIDFDNTLLEPNSIWIEYQNSFMDAGQNLHFRKLDFANGKIFTATTHTASNNVSGFGKIATLHYQIKSSLATDEVLNIGLTQANHSNATGLITPLTSGTGTLMAIGASVGVKENLYSGNVLVSPNPTNGLLNISFNSIPQNTKIELYNSIGALVLTEPMSNKNNTINVGDLSSGVYFMKVLEGNKVVAVKKVVKE
jgi:uncharacterized delta-60 repeat protein